MSPGHVAIVGAGASGTIQALHLLRQGVRRLTLIEREREPGRGTAYGTRRPEHLLNVTARRMIVWPTEPDHFARWWGERYGGDPDDYAPRMLFGDYLTEQLAGVRDRIEIVEGEAADVVRTGAAEEVRLGDGRTVAADAVILALGNLRPASPAGLDPVELDGALVTDPWFGGFADGLAAEDNVLLVGTALTAVDAALTLDATGFKGRVVALSRRGLLPRPHLKQEGAAGTAQGFPRDGLGLLRHVRKRAGEIGWREAVQEMRPITQQLWSGAPLDQRRRFIRHLRPWWDVHRHRIAPAVAERIEAMQREGRLTVVAGKIRSSRMNGGTAEVQWRPRGGDDIETLRAKRIVNCSGPDLDIARTPDPLLEALQGSGRIRADACRLGIDVDGASRVISAGGEPSPTLTAIGPITRGAFWESIAVPDIAVQAQAVADRIAGEDRR